MFPSHPIRSRSGSLPSRARPAPLPLSAQLLAGLTTFALAALSPLAAHAATPRLIDYVAPRYPELALLASNEATVVCKLHISPEGAVTEADCDDAPGKSFADAAKAAWLKCRFAPMEKPLLYAATARFGVAINDEVEASSLAEAAERKSTLEGEVLEAGARVGLAGADIVVQGLGVTALTDKTGKFKLELPVGDHELVFSRGDYKPTRVRVRVLPDAKDNPPLSLRAFRRSTVSMEATVRAPKDVTLAPTTSEVAHEELRNVPGTNNDPVGVIQDLPGVARAPYAAGQLVVRGAQPQDTGAFFDGQKIPILYHLLNGPSVLSEEMVERIDFLPGGAGVYFGRQLAGVVDIIPRSDDVDRLHGSASVDLNKTAAFLRGPIGDSTFFAVGGRISYVNPFLKLTANPNETYQVPLYWDYQGRLDQRLPDGARLIFTAFGSGDSFSQINPGRGTAAAYSDQEIHFHRFQLKYEKTLSPGWTLTIAPQAGFGDDVTTTTGQGAGAFSLPSETADQQKDLGLRAQLAKKGEGDSLFRFGVDSSYEKADYQVDEQVALALTGVQSGTTAEEVRSNGTQHFGNLGTYADYSFTLGDFRLTPGVRLDWMHWTGGDYAMFDPRIWGKYQFTPAFDMYAYAGVYHEAPLATQLDAKIGNPGLTPERANQYGLGGDYKYGSDWTFKIEGFYQNRSALPFAGTPSLGPDGNVIYPLLVNSGIARSMGVEVMIRRELTSSVYGWIAYTFSRSQQLERPGLPWEPTDYDQPHVLTLLVAYRRSTQAEVALRARVTSGNPIRNVTGSVFDSDSGNYLPIQGAFGTGRLPPFVQLDILVNNLWTTDNFKLSMYIELDNLLNRNNAEGIAYDYRFSVSSYVPGQPLDASIGAKIAF